METNETQKAKKVSYTKELRAKRDELTVRLKSLDPTQEEFEKVRNAIEQIDKILNEKTSSRWRGAQVGGMLFLTAVGIGLAHRDDIGTSIPGKFVSKIVDNLFSKIQR